MKLNRIVQMFTLALAIAFSLVIVATDILASDFSKDSVRDDDTTVEVYEGISSNTLSKTCQLDGL